MIDLKNIKNNIENRVVWHDYIIKKEDRSRLKGHKPCVIWLTGLSCAGKSTIANALEERLNELNIHTFNLDGDNVRHGLNKDLSFSDEDRSENIRRVGEIIKFFIDSGLIVIAAFISPFKKDRLAVRELVEKKEFIEVYINTPLYVCEKRDTKGFYEKARKGMIKKFTGIDSPYEPPENHEIEIKTDECSVDYAVDNILTYLKKHEII